MSGIRTALLQLPDSRGELTWSAGHHQVQVSRGQVHRPTVHSVPRRVRELAQQEAVVELRTHVRHQVTLLQGKLYVNIALTLLQGKLYINIAPTYSGILEHHINYNFPFQIFEGKNVTNLQRQKTPAGPIKTVFATRSTAYKNTFSVLRSPNSKLKTTHTRHPQ